MIYKDFGEFIEKKKEGENGCSQEWLDENKLSLKDFKKDNQSNKNCWNCKGCKGCEECEWCVGCEGCKGCEGCIEKRKKR